MNRVKKWEAKHWKIVAQMFGETGDKFDDPLGLVLEVYEATRNLYTSEQFKNGIKRALDKNPRRLPSPQEFRAYCDDVPTDSRNRASESAEKIWNAVGAVGAYRAEDAKNLLNFEEWQVVENHGGWYVLCENLTYDHKHTWIAQTRDYLDSLYSGGGIHEGNNYRQIGEPSEAAKKALKLIMGGKDEK
jgi:hypothetical protein